MDRARIAEEVIELICHKLHALPLPGDDPEFDYEGQIIRPNVTDNPLDIAETAMDLEDAFSISFGERAPGDSELPTIGDVIDFIHETVKARA